MQKTSAEMKMNEESTSHTEKGIDYSFVSQEALAKNWLSESDEEAFEYLQ